jgi:hypothetical protein
MQLNKLTFLERSVKVIFFLCCISVVSCNKTTNDKLISVDINTGKQGKTIEVEPFKAYDLSGYGTQFGVHETSCKGRFAYTKLKGDFDVFCRVENVTNSAQQCAAAGLMARISAHPEAPFVKVVANSFNRVWKEYDPYVMGVRYENAGSVGKHESWQEGFIYCIPDSFVNHDIPFPMCWLRLKRQGNSFTGYFAETLGVPTENDWKKYPFSWVLGNGPKGPTFIDSLGVFPDEMLVGTCLEANVEGDPGIEAFASFRDINGLSKPITDEYRAEGEQGKVVEISFNTNKQYTSPFNNVFMDVVFTDPQKAKHITIPAFYAGDGVWRVRYASMNVGDHQFITKCNDTLNSDLHLIKGAVLIKPYKGNNPFYQHGAITVSGDKKHFAHADGTPFLWIGDTWWMGLVKRLHWFDEFQLLVNDRAKKGFNVVQITAGLYGDLNNTFDYRAEGEGGYPWDNAFSEINTKYFDAADKRILYLANSGIAPCIVGSWGYWMRWLGAEKTKQYWRYLIARWGAMPVVWCIAGETTNPWYLSEQISEDSKILKEQWSYVLSYVDSIEPFGRLITTHPKHATNSWEEVNNPSLLDFNMQQSGHNTMPEGQVTIALKGWEFMPDMPTISGESRYERLTLKREWVSPEENLKLVNGLCEIGSKEARQAFWSHILASGCAGHTYGASGIFQINTDEWKFGKGFSGVNWGTMSWNDAMKLPGSEHIAIAKTILLKYPWNRFRPNAEAFEGDIIAAATDDKTCAIALATAGKAINLQQDGFHTFKSALWYDPTTGVSKPAVLEKTDNHREGFVMKELNSTGDSDWILVLSAHN